MAIEYSLYLDTEYSTSETAVELINSAVSISQFEKNITVEEVLDDGAATASGTWVRILPTSTPQWHPINVDLRLNPTVRVAFRLDKFGDLEYQTDMLVGIAAGLLERVRGDAALTRSLEQVWLLRRDDTLYLNERDELWTSRRLRFISHPFERVTYTFSDE